VAERGVDYTRLGALIGLVTAPTILIDQASKRYVVHHFRMYETWPLIRNWLDLTYTLNPGAAFSLFAPLWPLVVLGALTASGVAFGIVAGAGLERLVLEGERVSSRLRAG